MKRANLKPYPAVTSTAALRRSATAYVGHCAEDSRWFIPLERQGLQDLLNERKELFAAGKRHRGDE